MPRGSTGARPRPAAPARSAWRTSSSSRWTRDLARVAGPQDYHRRLAALVDGDELLDHADRVLAGNRAQAPEDLDLQLAGFGRGDGDDVLKGRSDRWANVAADVLA